MFCKWCGMESVTADQCSWCHRSFATATEEAASEPTAAPAPVEEPLVEEAHESPLAAGLTAPIAASVPPEPTAPVAAEPPAAPASPSPASAPSGRPSIGVRRPAGKAPAPGMPAGRPPTPAPPIAAQKPTIPPKRATPSAPTPATSRPAVPAALANAGRPPTPEPTVAMNSAPAAPPANAAQAAAEAHVPQLGTFRAQNSKYYAGQVIDPVSGTHYDAETGKPTADPLTEPQIGQAPPLPAQQTTAAQPAKPAKKKEPEVVLKWDRYAQLSFQQCLTKFLMLFLPVLVGACLVAAFLPRSIAIPMVVANLIGGILLPVTKVVPWHDEDSDDLMLYALLTVMFGPFIPLVIYGVLWMIRGGGNTAIVGCGLVTAATRLGVELAAGMPTLAQFMPWQGGVFSLGALFFSWAGIVTLVGWIIGNSFHKMDE